MEDQQPNLLFPRKRFGHTKCNVFWTERKAERDDFSECWNCGETVHINDWRFGFTVQEKTH